MSCLESIKMIDKKFTDEEIINRLEYMRKNADEGYMAHLENGGEVDKNEEEYIDILCGTLDLINRLKSEIERLKECPKCVYEYDGEITEYCVQSPCPNFKTVEQIKSEAVKEFAERLKNEIINDTAYACDSTQHSGYYDYQIKIGDIPEYIDNLIKEMTEVNENE